MRDIGKIARIVRNEVEADFAGVKFLDVRVNADVDSDGNDILRIDVLFDGEPRDLDAKKVAGIVRRVRPELIRLAEEQAFPLFSFISRSDLGAEHFAAA